MFSRFDTIPACDGQTDRQTDIRAYAEHRAVKSYNSLKTSQNNSVARFVSDSFFCLSDVSHIPERY